MPQAHSPFEATFLPTVREKGKSVDDKSNSIAEPFVSVSIVIQFMADELTH